MAGELAESARRVQRALEALGLAARVVELPGSARTAAEAAAAIGCRAEQIVKSLVFRRIDTGAAVLVLASGPNRVDERLAAAHLGAELAKADAPFVRAATGFAIGGVPPLGHERPIETLIDEDLLRQPTVWAAAGTPHAVFEIEPGTLVRATGGRVVAVAAVRRATSGEPAEATPVRVRRAEARELDRLAAIWHDGWQDAHAAILPAELAALRTLESFRERLGAALPRVRVFEAAGEPVGFCLIRDDELDQLYVSAAARGTGAAAALLAEAESRLRADGVSTAWLACAIGNDRAARFYEKHGWRRTGVVVHRPETSAGPFPLEVWRYEKDLGP
jgi:prolyl-tRNA editing enzyme YbaK/EbsC (Cys-tRNA(Pro) deacylase)/ribosomal protein S18 acetylase RimI-like enzyme